MVASNRVALALVAQPFASHINKSIPESSWIVKEELENGYSYMD
jgi:hypothetical protein